jgi:hypothetical protein
MTAGEYFAFYRSTWADPDWRALTVDSQHAYLMLGSHPDRDRAGVLSLTPRKWQRLAADYTADRLDRALKELDGASFVVADEDTQELLVRAFVRRDEVWRHVRMLNLALNDVERVESPRLRSALGQELARLPRVPIPEPASRTPKALRAVDEALAVQQRLDELVSMLDDSAPEGFVHPMTSSHELGDDVIP